MKDYQVGSFREKTPFPYKTSDLKLLIGKVLQRIEPEIKAYFDSGQVNDFTRHGKMAVAYNGDHYHIRINREGRLVQFHTVE